MGIKGKKDMEGRKEETSECYLWGKEGSQSRNLYNGWNGAEGWSLPWNM